MNSEIKDLIKMYLDQKLEKGDKEIAHMLFAELGLIVSEKDIAVIRGADIESKKIDDLNIKVDNTLELLKCICEAEFQLSVLIGSNAGECDIQRQVLILAQLRSLLDTKFLKEILTRAA